MKTVRLVLGFSPGSASDQIARAVAPEASRRLGATIDIELRPGRNGATAACEVACAKPDGRTLFMATLGTHALAPYVDRELPYDPLAHFAAVSLIATAPLVLACNRGLQISNVRALIDRARNGPHTLSYGTSAIGGAPHLAAELFQMLAKVEMRHVRYDRTEQLYDDLEAGVVSLSFNNIMSMLERCARGRLSALAVTGAQRSAAAPALPTVAESGLEGYDVANWVGVVVPKATPVEVVNELSAAFAAALQSDAVADRFRAAGVTPCGSTPADFESFVKRELTRWGPVVRRFSADAAAAPPHSEHPR